MHDWLAPSITHTTTATVTHQSHHHHHHREMGLFPLPLMQEQIFRPHSAQCETSARFLAAQTMASFAMGSLLPFSGLLVLA